MRTEKLIQENINQNIEICEECNSEINCEKENIYILTKEENEKLWCQCCFEELWKEYSINGWTGDDIEYYLELENEEKETS
jgi:citrate lyase synthetase